MSALFYEEVVVIMEHFELIVFDGWLSEGFVAKRCSTFPCGLFE